MSYSHSRTTSIVSTHDHHSISQSSDYTVSGTKVSNKDYTNTNGGGSSTSVTFTQRHPKYYIDAGDLHILAGRTLFRVHSYFFSRESPIFNKRLIPASPGDVREGTTDTDPVILEDVSAGEFEIFCWVFYNPQYSLYDAPLSQWRTILNLAHKWDFPQIKELVVRQLHMKPSSEFPLTHKLAMYEKYHVSRKSIVPLYVELCARDRPLTLGESRVLGVESAWLVGVVRERVRVGKVGVPDAEDQDIHAQGWRSPLPKGVSEDDVYKIVEEELKRMQEEQEGEVDASLNLSTDLDWLEQDTRERESLSSPVSSPRQSTIKLRNLGHGGKRGGRISSMAGQR